MPQQEEEQKKLVFVANEDTFTYCDDNSRLSLSLSLSPLTPLNIPKKTTHAVSLKKISRKKWRERSHNNESELWPCFRKQPIGQFLSQSSFIFLFFFPLVLSSLSLPKSLSFFQLSIYFFPFLFRLKMSCLSILSMPF